MLNAVILGLIQGITEFLPVSSSGHLIIARELLGMPLQNTLAFDVLLHLATLFAIIFCFFGEIRRIAIDFRTGGLSSRSSRLVAAIIIGTVPAALAGFFLGDIFESYFRNPEFAAYALLGGSAVFFLADKASELGSHSGISKTKGLIIGFFQSLALIPGVSRSGIAVSGGLFTGLSREESLKFAFLLGIPVIAGAAVKTFLDIGLSVISFSEFLSLPSLIGFAAALVSGIWAVKFLMRYLSTHSFAPFILYRIAIAAVILYFL